MTIAFSVSLSGSSQPNNNLIYRLIVPLTATGGKASVRFRSGDKGLTLSRAAIGVSTGNGEMSGAVELKAAGAAHGLSIGPNSSIVVEAPFANAVGDAVIEFAIPVGDGVNGGSFPLATAPQNVIYWQGGATWNPSGPRDAAALYAAVDQVEVLAADPPAPGPEPFTPYPGGEVCLDDKTITVADNGAFLDLRNTSGIDYEKYRIELYSVYALTHNPDVIPTGYGGVLELLLATDADGLVFDEGPHYTSAGMFVFGPWPQTLPDAPPSGVGSWGARVELSEGLVIGTDNVSVPENGWNGDVKIRCPGTVGGVPVNVSVRADLTQDDGYQPDEHYPQGGTRGAFVSCAGGWQIGSPGLRPRGFRLCCNRESAVNATIVGRAKLYGIV